MPSGVTIAIAKPLFPRSGSISDLLWQWWIEHQGNQIYASGYRNLSDCSAPKPLADGVETRARDAEELVGIVVQIHTYLVYIYAIWSCYDIALAYIVRSKIYIYIYMIKWIFNHHNNVMSLHKLLFVTTQPSILCLVILKIRYILWWFLVFSGVRYLERTTWFVSNECNIPYFSLTTNMTDQKYISVWFFVWAIFSLCLFDTSDN